MQLIQVARRNIRSLLEQCDIPYGITSFDDVLYQECIEDAIQRGYPVDGSLSVRTFLREGVVYAATAGAHIPDRQTQIWIATYTSCTIFVDETSGRFPSELESTYRFNDRFLRREPQGSAVLDAFADLIHRAFELYPSIASHLITTSTLNFVAANLLEHETKSMKVSDAAQQYPTYQRTLSGDSQPYSFMAFPREIPLNDYIQAIPELATFIDDANDVFSFYKEEKAGETTNQVSTLASQKKISKFDAFDEVTETTISLYKRILKILEGSPEACDAFRRFAAGYVRFHISTPRYHIDDLSI